MERRWGGMNSEVSNFRSDEHILLLLSFATAPHSLTFLRFPSNPVSYHWEWTYLQAQLND
jgi:hypothetical protein